MAILKHLSHLAGVAQQMMSRAWKDYSNISTFCPKENSLVFNIAAKSQVLLAFCFIIVHSMIWVYFWVAVELLHGVLVSSKFYLIWNYVWLLCTESFGAPKFQPKVKGGGAYNIHKRRGMETGFSVLLLPNIVWDRGHAACHLSCPSTLVLLLFSFILVISTL